MSYTSENLGLIRANNTSTAFDTGDITENTVNAYANLFYPYILDNGGNTKIVSLTIDILNESDLQDDTLDLPNKSWVNENRLRNNLPTSKTIWAFKESYHGVKKSRAISNAFCFGGQKLTFYIAPKGHSAGNDETSWLYCKTLLTISAVDIINGTNTTLYTFDTFEDSDDADSRYFTWEVPSINNTAFAQYGLFGVVVLRMDITETYYEDGEFKVVSTKNLPNKNQSHLQLLVYSGAKEIIEVNAGAANILTSTPDYTDTLEQIFSKTVFESLQSLNQNPLTSAQKRAIVADQIATLFISQHPVVNADFYPSSVIGFGALQAVIPQKIIENIVTYGKQYPDIVALVKDRLFGMFATYKYFNFSVDIESVISDYLQSSQITIDPVRTILMDTDGVVQKDMGVDGLIFNPYTMQVSHAETILNPPEPISIDVALYDGLVDVNNILITDVYGNDLISTDTQVKVAFGVVWGSANIQEIRYSIWAMGCSDYQTYLDVNVSSRSHIFELYGQVDPNTDGQSITAQVDIEDYTGAITSFVANTFVQEDPQMPYLRDLKIYQRNDGSDIVEVYYTYVDPAEVENAYVYVQFSVDGGVTWSIVPTTTVKGDFGNDVMPGRRKIFWQPAIDLEGVTITGAVLCRLTLYNIDSQLAIGESLTGALAYDLTKPEVTVVRSNVKYVSEISPIALYADSTYVFYDTELKFEYFGKDGTIATIILNGQSFVVGNISGSFVWDVDGVDVHVFGYEGDSISVTVGYVVYSITYRGTGSLLFDIRLTDVFSSSSSSSSSSESSPSSNSSSSRSSVSSPSSNSSSSVSSISSPSSNSSSSISSPSSNSSSSRSSISSSSSNSSSSNSSYSVSSASSNSSSSISSASSPSSNSSSSISSASSPSSNSSSSISSASSPSSNSSSSRSSPSSNSSSSISSASSPSSNSSSSISSASSPSSNSSSSISSASSPSSNSSSSRSSPSSNSSSSISSPSSPSSNSSSSISSASSPSSNSSSSSSSSISSASSISSESVGNFSSSSSSISSESVGNFSSSSSSSYGDVWTLTVLTTTPNESFNVVLNGTTLNITVQWGDTTSNTYTTTGPKNHTFVSAGTYYVKISGALTGTNASVIFYTVLGNTSNKIKATTAINGVTGITTIHDATSNYGMFQGAGLTSIPYDLFYYLPSIRNNNGFYNAFSSCTSLTSIPAGLFDKQTGLTGSAFYYTFFNCTSLTSIPSGLFDKQPLLTTYAFLYAFLNCTGLTSIPAGLFDKQTILTEGGFYGTFMGCTSLTSVPTGLFDKQTGLTKDCFGYTFYGCTSLASIPTGLFDKNTLVSSTAFNYTFYGCTKLTAIPTGLFDNNTGITTTPFYYCFKNCTNLQGPAPTLWLTYAGADKGVDCFLSDTSLSNYPDIPAQWGGGGDENSSSSSSYVKNWSSSSSSSSSSSYIKEWSSSSSSSSSHFGCCESYEYSGSIHLSGLNGTYIYQGAYAGHAYYYSGSYYLFYNTLDGYWNVSGTLGGDYLLYSEVNYSDCPFEGLYLWHSDDSEDGYLDCNMSSSSSSSSSS